eukprot:m.181113 g.181113  ORF g.181113 m.181113 type:complete len:538 (+) comp53461_c0_seq4:79-1692(+)
MAGGGLGAAAAASASYAIVIQVVFRLLTFAVNGIALRYISRDMLGVVNVRLTLLFTSILFLSREAFRKACLSDRANFEKRWPAIANTMWLCVPIGVVYATLLSWVWISSLDAPDLGHYTSSVVCFAVSAVLELATEPLWLLAQFTLNTRLRPAAEGIALTTRCLTIIVLLVLRPELGLHIFSIAFLLYAVVLNAVYIAYFLLFPQSHNGLLRSYRSFLPQSIEGQWWFRSTGAAVVPLVAGFLKQSVLKQLLTEGERFMMTFLRILTFTEQGVYDVVNNLCALVPRLIFQPLEENYYTYFAGLLSRERSADSSDAQRANKIQAAQTLSTLLRFVLLVSLMVLTFAQAYSFLALNLYAGSILSDGDGPLLLRVFSFYLLLLAVNGMTECFMFAAMSQVEVERHNLWMIGFSLVFLFAAYFLTQWFGSVGFTLANCINMLIRIVRSLQYINAYYASAGLNPRQYISFLPRLSVCVVLLVALVLTKLSEALFCCDAGVAYQLLHLAVGGVLFVLCAAVVFIKERALFGDLRGLFSKQKDA